MKDVQQHLDKLYAELAALKRYVLLHLPMEQGESRRAWEDLREASKEITMRWTGSGAVAEIRTQREK